MFEERPQQGRLTPGLAKRLLHRLSQSRDILRQKVRQIPILGLRPDLFIRIKLRSIRRQPFDLQAMGKPCQEPSGRRAMDLPAVQDQDKSLRQVLKQPDHERFDIGSPKVVLVKGKVQAQPPALGRVVSRIFRFFVVLLRGTALPDPWVRRPRYRP